MYFDEGLPEYICAERLKVTKQAINQALTPFKQRLLPKEQLNALEQRQNDFLKGGVYSLILDSLDPIKREKASVNNLMFGAKELYNIYRLETGQSTTNEAIQLGLDRSTRSMMLAASRKNSQIGGDISQDNRDKAQLEPLQSLNNQDNLEHNDPIK
jgi:hypothetical protein